MKTSALEILCNFLKSGKVAKIHQTSRFCHGIAKNLLKRVEVFFAILYTGKKSALNETHQNGFVDLKKRPNELICRKKLKFRNTEPYVSVRDGRQL